MDQRSILTDKLTGAPVLVQLTTRPSGSSPTRHRAEFKVIAPGKGAVMIADIRLEQN